MAKKKKQQRDLFDDSWTTAERLEAIDKLQKELVVSQSSIMSMYNNLHEAMREHSQLALMNLQKIEIHSKDLWHKLDRKGKLV